MTDATTGGLTEQMYCSQQINVPLNLPYILKQYAKAAIRTQPSDLLYWSAIYFRALADGTTPPVKERIEYPPISSPSGLSPGFLKVLINQFGKAGVVFEREIESRWLGVGLKQSALEEIFKLTGNEKSSVRWLNFVAVAAGYLCPSLTQTMILICELLTDDPDGGPAAIQLDIFLPLYKYLARLNCGPISKQESPDTSNIDEICVTRQHSLQSTKATDDNTKKDINELNEEMEGEIYTIKHKSEDGLEVWQDIEPPVKKSDMHFSQEGQTSETGLVIFETFANDAITPGYTDPSKVDHKKLKSPPPTSEKEAKQPTETENKKTKEKESETDDSKEKVQKVKEGKEEEIGNQEGGDLVNEKANAQEINKEIQPEEGASDYAAEEKKIQDELKAGLQEEKRKRDNEKAERKRLREEAKAEKKRLKELKKAEHEKQIEADDQKGTEKKKKRKKILNEAGEVIGELDEEDLETFDVGEEEDDEDLESESSTASSTISIDPDLEVISSSQILHKDEVWEEIEIEEESLDDEENKVIRKVKKRVKKKVEKSKKEGKVTSLSVLEKEAKRAAELEHELETKRLHEPTESLEGIKGRPKEEVRASGMLNLCKGVEDMVSLMSEPEVFEYSFIHIPGIGPTVPERQIKKVVKYMTDCSNKQGGYVMPRNIRHFLCPPLDVECRNTENSIESTVI